MVTAALGTTAKPADAFVITNSSASWDNLKTRGGSIVGSDGIAASDNNLVKFLDVDGVSQVRWGEAAYGGYYKDVVEEVTEEVTEYVTEEVEVEKRVKKTRSVPKRNKKGQIQRNRKGKIKYRKETYYETITTTKEVKTPVKKQVTKQVTNQVWVPPTYENQSGLGFQGVSDLTLEVGEVFNVGQLFHYNQTIYGSDFTGESAEFSLMLDFGDTAIGSQAFNFSMSIDETTNYKGSNNNGADCAYYTTAGLGCSDRIDWDFAVDDSSSFTYDGEEYSLELVGFADDLVNRGTVSEFISQEEANNSANLFARLVKVDTTQDIPEPASLLGLAGLGMYFARSRKKRTGEQLV